MSDAGVVSADPKRYTVVMRGPAALVFRQDQAFGFNDFPSPLGPIQVTYRSRWPVVANNIRMPGQLWVEVNGSGPTFEIVVPVLANAALAGLPITSVACNVAIPE